jgi:hypothetical protein
MIAPYRSIKVFEKNPMNGKFENTPEKRTLPGKEAAHSAVRLVYLPLFMLALVLSLTGMPHKAGAESTFDDAAMKKVLQPWKGDLKGMIERRLIRVLVTYNKTDFFPGRR